MQVSLRLARERSQPIKGFGIAAGEQLR